MATLPSDPSRIDAAWFSAVLGTRVDRTEVEPVARQGRASRTYRVRLQSRGEPADPPSVIVKCFLDDPQVQSRRLALGTYRLEVDFYETFGPSLGGLVPSCLHAQADDRTGYWLLVLEDLGDGHEDDQHGDTGDDAARVLTAARAIARIHARLWEDERITGLFARCKLPGMFDQRAIGVVERQITADLLRDKLANRDLPEVLIAAANAELDRHDRLVEHLHSRPVTCVHGDYRTQQVLRDRRAPGEVRIIDWQTPHRATGALDLQRLLLHAGFSPARRRAVEPDAITAYHETLCARGITGYSRQALEHDYRLLLHHSLMWALMEGRSDDPEAIAFWRRTFVDPLESALADHAYVDLIESL